MTIASGATNLLVIGVDRIADIAMKDEAHVRLVDTHAKGDGGHDDLDAILHKRYLDTIAIACRQTGVIKGAGYASLRQGCRDLLGMLPRGRVDDAWFLCRDHSFHQGALFHIAIGEGLHTKPDIGTVEAPHDDAGCAQPQTAHNLVTNWRRGGGRQCQHAWVAHSFH